MHTSVIQKSIEIFQKVKTNKKLKNEKQHPKRPQKRQSRKQKRPET